MPYITEEGAGGPPQPGFFGGWLGRVRDPLFVLRDPNAPDFAMPELASAGRRRPPAASTARKRSLDEIADGAHGDAAAPQRDGRLPGPGLRPAHLAGSRSRRSSIDREPAAVRDRYGRNIYGQSVLLARRLIEAGTRVACISWAPDANATWDTHGNNFIKLKNELLPQLDAALSSLLDDLADRGMLERTLVAVMGEFGRSPQDQRRRAAATTGTSATA